MEASLWWVLPAVALLGVVGQWGIGAYYAGRLTQKVDDQAGWLKRHDAELQNSAAQMLEHEGRIARVEGRLGITSD